MAAAINLRPPILAAANRVQTRSMTTALPGAQGPPQLEMMPMGANLARAIEPPPGLNLARRGRREFINPGFQQDIGDVGGGGNLAVGRGRGVMNSGFQDIDLRAPPPPLPVIIPDLGQQLVRQRRVRFKPQGDGQIDINLPPPPQLHGMVVVRQGGLIPAAMGRRLNNRPIHQIPPGH